MSRFNFIVLFSLLVVASMIGLLLLVDVQDATAAVSPADDWGQDCYHAGKCMNTTDGKVNFAVCIGCRCNYEGTNARGEARTHVVCDEEQDLICSSNNANVSPYSVCLMRLGYSCKEDVVAPNGIKGGSAVCEAGGKCVANLCELDSGGEFLEGALGSEVSDIRDTIRRFINIGLGFLGVLTVIFVIYGGVLWLTAAGNEERVTKGKHTLMWAAIGAVVISIAWTIASYVLNVGKFVS